MKSLFVIGVAVCGVALYATNSICRDITDRGVALAETAFTKMANVATGKSEGERSDDEVARSIEDLKVELESLKAASDGREVAKDRDELAKWKAEEGRLERNLNCIEALMSANPNSEVVRLTSGISVPLDTIRRDRDTVAAELVVAESHVKTLQSVAQTVDALCAENMQKAVELESMIAEAENRAKVLRAARPHLDVRERLDAAARRLGVALEKNKHQSTVIDWDAENTLSRRGGGS